MAVRLCVGLVCAAAALVGLSASAQVGQPRPSDPARVDFNWQIRPLLSDRCFRCHGPDASKRKKKLRLDTRDGAVKDIGDGWWVIKPGDPSSSELIRRINSDFEDDVMPPPESHLTLSADEKALLRQWVAEGAEYKPHWSLIPVHSVAVPNSAAGRHPIDAFVHARLDRDGLRPAPEASREVLIRAARLRPDRFAAVARRDRCVRRRSIAWRVCAIGRSLSRVAGLWRAHGHGLARPRALRRHIRLSERLDRDMSAYRDWVIHAFNQNLPYDQFLTWQLAGDLLASPTREQRIATAFNRLHRQTNEGGSVEEEFRTEYVSDRVNTFGTAMLGLTLECARCHDHKFDPILQRDYYSLFAFFNSIDESGLYSHFTNATPSPSMLLWPEAAEKQHQELKVRMAALETRLPAEARAARPAFERWIAAAELAPPLPVSGLAFDVVTDGRTLDSVTGGKADVQDGLTLVTEPSPQSPSNAAMRFSGDSAVVASSVPSFLRTDAFSFSLRIKPTEAQDRAVIFHQSRAWTDAGSRGFELTLDRGRPFFGLIHFWPGNAIAVRTRQPLPLNRWSRLVITYDGSSRAAGIRLYLDGTRLETDVVRDHLYKDIGYRREAGDRSSDTHPLTIGARFRDSGFKNGLIDDFQVFDVALTDAEVAGVLRRDSSDAASLAHYLARQHQPSIMALQELRRLREEENRLVADVPELMVMEEMASPRPAHVLARGAYDAPGEIVTRDTPRSLPPFPQNQPRDRLGLARWLTDRGNPLAARVVVNRIWRQHFGRGIVASPEDFGSQGKLPTHPELLDWLAGWFMDHGWDVKALHRLIVTSETYKQSSAASADAVRRDPDNLLLARGPKMRLLAEEIRDSALAASGLLNRTIGGASVKPYQPAGLWEQSGTGKSYVQDHGLKLYRRSLYTFWRRTSPPPSMITFDAVTREVCTAKREVTATPLQSLVLLNDPQFVEAGRVLAERLMKQYRSDATIRNRDAFRTLIGREPDEKESQILLQLFDEQRQLYGRDAASAALWLSVGESSWDESLPRADFAAMAAVTAAIMNFDEFVVVR